MKKEKQIPSKKFSDDRMFSFVMEDPSICLRAVTLLTGKPKLGRPNITREKFLGENPFLKSIRLDIFVEFKNLVCDIEMQKYSLQGFRRRIRTYMAMINSRFMRKGDAYKSLRDAIVIFICLKDPFGENKPVYHFTRYDSILNLQLNDGEQVLVHNCSSAEQIENEQLKNFLLYIRDNIPRDSFTKEIDMKVKAINDSNAQQFFDDIARLDLQTAKEEAKAEGVAIGEAKGIAIGEAKSQARIKQILKICRDSGMAMSDIMKIANVTKEEILAL